MERRARDVVVAEHALEHKAAIALHVGEEHPVTDLVVVGEQSQQGSAWHVSG